MAIDFARLAIHTRTKGHSAIAAAAYRAGIELYDERTGESFDFSERQDVAYTEILLPENTHEKFTQREYLWNQAEHAEKRKDAQIAKELTLAIPKELELSDQIELAKRFAKEHFLSHGLVVDVSIHNKGDGNPHAHLLISMRRLEQAHFSLKKARDLNPVFYGKDRKTVYDFWHEKWRDCQNDYFQERGLDLNVDANFLLATRHQGRVRNPHTEHYLQTENGLLKEASYEQAVIDPKVILSHLTDRYATFTDKDIARVVFKNTDNTQDYELVLHQVKSDQSLLLLGNCEDGRAIYTTRETYQTEQTMIHQAISLSGKKDKAISHRQIEKAIKTHGLSEEQGEAITYLLHCGDVGCLVGRAGTGKTYAMKAAHELYAKQGYTVYGAALSGVAAKALQSATGIKSDTIHSLSYRIEKGSFAPRAGSVIVIDEAGMVSLRDMARIISYAKQHQCKVLLLGDPEQLQAIEAGAPFRAIMDHVGFVEMRDIRRQHDLEDRKASQNLAIGKVGLAVDHYHQKGQLHLMPEEEAKAALLAFWQSDLKNSHQPNFDDRIVLAFTRKQVAELNLLIRDHLIAQKLLNQTDPKPPSIQTASGDIQLTEGDRILFLKNNYELNVFNGDFATVQSVSGTSKNAKITIELKGRTLTFNTKDYNDFNYGYAATVHKSQGTTFDKAYVYIDSYGWDRHLAYVAMTRHKETLQIFANQDRFRDLEKLKRTLSRAPIRDNAIDYPLSFAERRGFDPEKMLGRTLNYLAGIHHKIRDGWLYMTNYETWVITREHQTKIEEKQQIRKEAKIVAEFADLNQSVNRGWSAIYREMQRQNQDNLSAHPKYNEVVELTNARNRLAHDIETELTKHQKALEANDLKLSDIQRYAEEHLKRARPRNKTQDQTQKQEQKQENSAQTDILHHPDWKNLSSDKVKNRLLKERIDLLKEIHQNALDYANDPGKLKYFMKAMASVLRKIQRDKAQSRGFAKVAPKFAKTIWLHLQKLEKKHGISHDISLEHDRA